MSLLSSLINAVVNSDHDMKSLMELRDHIRELQKNQADASEAEREEIENGLDFLRQHDVDA